VASASTWLKLGRRNPPQLAPSGGGGGIVVPHQRAAHITNAAQYRSLASALQFPVGLGALVGKETGVLVVEKAFFATRRCGVAKGHALDVSAQHDVRIPLNEVHARPP